MENISVFGTEDRGSNPLGGTNEEFSNPPRSLRRVRRPNCREFWAKKSIGGFVCGEAASKRKFFNYY